MRVAEPKPRQSAGGRGLEVDVTDIRGKRHQVVDPLSRFQIQARNAVGIDSGCPGVALLVVVGVVRKEIRWHGPQFHLLASRLAGIEHPDEVAIESAPPQAILLVSLAATHSAAKAANTAR